MQGFKAKQQNLSSAKQDTCHAIIFDLILAALELDRT